MPNYNLSGAAIMKLMSDGGEHTSHEAIYDTCYSNGVCSANGARAMLATLVKRGHLEITSHHNGRHSHNFYRATPAGLAAFGMTGGSEPETASEPEVKPQATVGAPMVPQALLRAFNAAVEAAVSKARSEVNMDYLAQIEDLKRTLSEKATSYRRLEEAHAELQAKMKSIREMV